MMKHLATTLLTLIAGTLLASGPLEILKDQNGKKVRYAGRLSSAPVKIPRDYRAPEREMRGVWIATVENIDFARHRNAADFKKEFRAKLDRLAELNFNTILFQVRPTNDAFYPSRINPWSRYLTGEEGRGIPGFDPLRFMIDECHARNMEFHAWLNPYRVIGKTKLGKKKYLQSLDSKNFARKNPELVLAAPLSNGEELLVLNPGEPRVVRHVVDTVEEIARNYPVDAIHFDDYFYPYSNFGSIDAATHKRYGKGKSLTEWRRDNVTTLVREVRNTVNRCEQRKGRRIQFGISPFGIWANKKSIPSGSLTLGKQSYIAQFADTRGWMKENLVDYLVPQLYWEFNHDVAAYAALADWWAAQARGTKTKLYIGLGAYRMGSGAWQNPLELANQIRYNTKHPEIRGQILFSARNILSPANANMREGLNYIWKNYWPRRIQTP